MLTPDELIKQDGATDEDLIAYIEGRPDSCRPCLMIESVILRLRQRDRRIAELEQIEAHMPESLRTLLTAFMRLVELGGHKKEIGILREQIKAELNLSTPVAAAEADQKGETE